MVDESKFFLDELESRRRGNLGCKAPRIVAIRTHRYTYHHHIGGDIEATLHDGIMLEGRTLRVRRRHAPVALKRPASCKESDLGREPPDEDVNREPANNALVTKTKSEARVHYEHAHFDAVDYIEHCLLRDDDDLGAVYPLLDVLCGEVLLQLRWVEIRSTAICDDVEADYKACVEQLRRVEVSQVEDTWRYKSRLQLTATRSIR